MKIQPFDYAVYLLSLRLRSSGEIRSAMFRKGYIEKEIRDCIQRLTDLHYLNDDQFAQIYFENLKKYKQFGYYGIQRKLVDKKIATAEIHKLLGTLSMQEELAIARRLLSKYARKTKEQQVRALQSKGFRTEVIVKAVGRGYSEED